jgi:hypothetical protein
MASVTTIGTMNFRNLLAVLLLDIDPPWSERDTLRLVIDASTRALYDTELLSALRI